MASGSADSGGTSFGDDNLRPCSRMNTLLMFGEGATSSSDSSTADGSDPNPSLDLDRAASHAFFFFLELWPGEGSLPVVRSLFRPQETVATMGSLTDYSCEGGAVHGSTTMHSGT